MNRATTKPWGYHLMIDLTGVNHHIITKKPPVATFIKTLTDKIGMKTYGKLNIARFGVGKLLGISALQFIETSNIAVHCDEIDNRVYIDIFSCKKFNEYKAIKYAKEYFEAEQCQHRYFMR